MLNGYALARFGSKALRKGTRARNPSTVLLVLAVPVAVEVKEAKGREEESE